MKLHPYSQVFVAHKNNAKLDPKFFGPYKIVDCIGAVAYKLQLLLDHSEVHDVFHVSYLKNMLKMQ